MPLTRLCCGQCNGTHNVNTMGGTDLGAWNLRPLNFHSLPSWVAFWQEVLLQPQATSACHAHAYAASVKASVWDVSALLCHLQILHVPQYYHHAPAMVWRLFYTLKVLSLSSEVDIRGKCASRQSIGKYLRILHRYRSPCVLAEGRVQGADSKTGASISFAGT